MVSRSTPRTRRIDALTLEDDEVVLRSYSAILIVCGAFEGAAQGLWRALSNRGLGGRPHGVVPEREMVWLARLEGERHPDEARPGGEDLVRFGVDRDRPGLPDPGDECLERPRPRPVITGDARAAGFVFREFGAEGGEARLFDTLTATWRRALRPRRLQIKRGCGGPLRRRRGASSSWSESLSPVTRIALSRSRKFSILPAERQLLDRFRLLDRPFPGRLFSRYQGRRGHLSEGSPPEGCRPPGRAQTPNVSLTLAASRVMSLAGLYTRRSSRRRSGGGPCPS